MAEFNWSMPVLDVKGQDDEQEEFDIQPRLLKRRENKLKVFYVEYDRLTRHIVEITPEVKSKPSSIKNLILTTAKVDLVADVFSGKCPISKISVVYDREKKQHDIILNTTLFEKTEFDYVYAAMDNVGPVHLYCDLIFKKIRIVVDYDKLKKYISSDWRTEQSLERSNMHINIFCINAADKTMLFDRLHLNIFELCTEESLVFHCSWLPDLEEDLKNIGFVYYDNDMPITFSAHNGAPNHIDNDTVDKPQIVYKQKETTMLIQSIMMNPNSYKINDEITLYFFDKEDPTMLLGVKKIPRTSLNNYGVLEVEIDFKRSANVITDHLHLYLEDSNASTNYRF